jgi:phage I-like protein
MKGSSKNIPIWNNQSQAERVPSWIHLVPAGLFVGRDGRGPWNLSDPEGFIKTTFSHQAGADIPVDYEHQILSAEENGQPAPAAGWIKEMEAREDGIWGRVEWTPKAAQMIAAKEYKYISPVFYANETGELIRLESAALVGLPNLELRAINKQGAQHMDFLQQIASLLGLEEGATEEAIFSAIKALVESKAAPAANTTEDKEKVPSGQEGDSPAEDLSQAEAELLAAVETVVDKADEAVKDAATTANKAKNDQVKDQAMAQLLVRVSDMERSIKHERAANLVRMAMRAGKIAPSLKDWATDYATKDAAGFGKFILKMPVVVNTSNKSEAGRASRQSSAGLTSEERAVCKQLGISEADYLKTRTAATTASA